MENLCLLSKMSNLFLLCEQDDILGILLKQSIGDFDFEHY